MTKGSALSLSWCLRMWLLAVCVFVLALRQTACVSVRPVSQRMAAGIYSNPELDNLKKMNGWWMFRGSSSHPFLFTFFNIYRLQMFSSIFVLLLRVIPASFCHHSANDSVRSGSSLLFQLMPKLRGWGRPHWIKIFNTNVKPNVMHWLPLHLPHCIVCLTVNAIVLFLSYLLSVQLSANTPHQLESSPIRVPEVFGQETLLRQSGQIKLGEKTRSASIRG